MSVSMWSYRPEVCDGGGCPGDCDLCDKPKNMEEEDDTTDYIKRKDAINFIANGVCTDTEADMKYTINKFNDDIPSADVRENVKGKWIKDNYVCRCSACGKEALWSERIGSVRTDFCPNCGADMRGEV